MGGNDHPYQVGGAFSVAPYVEGAPLRLDEGEGSIRPGITDAHGNELSRLLYEGYASGGAGQTSLQDRQEFIHSLENSNNQDGVTLKRSLDMQSGLISQDWVWETVIPEYTLTNAALGNVQTFPASQYSLYYGNYFYLNSSDPVGTWTAGETVNLGPNGGVKNGTSTFEVYTNSSHPLTNDLVSGALSVPGMPLNLSQDTMGSTLSSGDPNLGRVSDLLFLLHPCRSGVSLV